MRTVTDALLAELGFPAWTNVAEKHSVADLFPAEKRCGIYVLGFSDGERYVGQSRNVVSRFLAHRRTYPDLTHLTFRAIPADELDEVEQRCIYTLEAAGMPLRNFTHMSTVQGERDFDRLVSPAEQQAWYDGQEELNDDEPHVHDQALRRRQKRKLSQFLALPHAQEALVFLGFYLQAVIPFPRRTEQQFWTVSCVPYGVESDPLVYCRVNLNMQEVFSVYRDAQGLYFSIHLAVGPLQEALGEDWETQLREEGFEVTGHRYRPGGQDQTEVQADSLEQLAVLLMLWETNRAMALMNLRLMRRGASYWPGSHSPELVDLAMEAFEVIRPELELGEEP